MKKVWSRGIVMVIAALFVSVFSINTSKAQASVSLQVFYDELQPYGTWMDYGNHGYVWVPRVDRGFTPYATNGYWINTEYGNTWVSDYSWGWAPFHYGRWLFDDFYGWMWVPDTQWGPAWVAWRSGGGYYGWAPLMPGVGINVSFNYYNGIPNHYWNFVPCRYITYRTVYNHCVPRPHVVNIINHTTIITNNYTDHRDRRYFSGPSRSEIERVNHERVPVYAVNDRTRPGRTEIDRGRVNFYKPEVDNSRDTRDRATPTQYMRVDERGSREMVDTRNGGPANFDRDRVNDSRRDMQPTDSPMDRINRNTQRSESSTERLQPSERQRGSSDFQRSEERRNTEQIQPREQQRSSDAFQRMERQRGSSDFQRSEERRNTEQMQPREQQRSSDAFQRMERQRENIVRDEQQQYQRRQQQAERPSSSMQQNQGREQFQQREMNRSQQPQQQQRVQQMERQGQRSSQSVQRQQAANQHLNTQPTNNGATRQHGARRRD